MKKKNKGGSFKLFIEINGIIIKGRRTYLAIAAAVITELISLYGTDIVVLSPEVTAAAVTFFAVLAAYFRKHAGEG